MRKKNLSPIERVVADYCREWNRRPSVKAWMSARAALAALCALSFFISQWMAITLLGLLTLSFLGGTWWSFLAMLRFSEDRVPDAVLSWIADDPYVPSSTKTAIADVVFEGGRLSFKELLCIESQLLRGPDPDPLAGQKKILAFRTPTQET